MRENTRDVKIPMNKDGLCQDTISLSYHSNKRDISYRRAVQLLSTPVSNMSRSYLRRSWYKEHLRRYKVTTGVDIKKARKKLPKTT